MSEESEGRNSMLPLGEVRKHQLKLAIDHFHQRLMDRPAMVDAIGEARGFTREMIAGFRLGIVHDVDGFPAYNRPQWIGRVSIPYFDASGEPTQVRFWSRRESPKYQTCPGDPQRLYNPAAIASGGDVREIGGEQVNVIHVAEGEFDAMSLIATGRSAIALPGSKFPMARLRHQLQGFTWIVVWADPDRAGREMAANIREIFPAQTLTVALTKDVNDTFKEGGAEALAEAESKALLAGGAYEREAN